VPFGEDPFGPSLSKPVTGQASLIDWFFCTPFQPPFCHPPSPHNTLKTITRAPLSLSPRLNPFSFFFLSLYDPLLRFHFSPPGSTPYDLPCCATSSGPPFFRLSGESASLVRRTTSFRAPTLTSLPIHNKLYAAAKRPGMISLPLALFGVFF